jgi:hypothetical protein
MLPPGEIEMKSDWYFGIPDDYFLDCDFPIDDDMKQEVDFTTYCDQTHDLYGVDIEMVECCLNCGVVPHGCVCV